MHCGLHIFLEGYALQQARGRPPSRNTCYDSYSVGEGIGDWLIIQERSESCSKQTKEQCAKVV